MSMQLSQLLQISAADLRHDPILNGLNLDSRHIQAGEVFCACQGTQVHGDLYIEQALQAGAVAVLSEQAQFNVTYLANEIPCITLPNLSQRLGELAARFYHDPSTDLTVVGITGTNGKTSVSHFIAQCLHTHQPCGLFGTLGYGLYGHLQTATHTTPDAIRLQALLASLREQQAAYLAMEVSSHALSQGRVNGIHFDTAVFTNLSHDHLDYHGTMQAYGAAKQRLFTMPGLKNAVINQDDMFGRSLLTTLASRDLTVWRYSLQDAQAEIYAHLLNVNADGSHIRVQTPQGTVDIQLPLYGQFNICNALATLAVLLQQGFELQQAQTLLQQLQAVSGRMQPCPSQYPVTVLIDYAHTPDALQQALQAVRQHCAGRLWCVFGCGGDRDKAKRPLMGRIAEQLADVVVVTDDNPRHEDSAAIIDAIVAGCAAPEQLHVIPDRQQAIVFALQHAAAQDVLLIAGKGHEPYQDIGGVKLPYSDYAVVQAA